MSGQHSRSPSHVAARRGELLAELFFQALDPVFVSRPTSDVLGYDLLVGFANDKAGVNTFAVEVKTTEHPAGSHYPIERRAFDRLAHSNLPSLLLVVDAKRSRFYYGWLRSLEAKSRSTTVQVPVVEINDTTKEELKRQFQRADGGVAVAG
jgi:hypothetical protein